MDHSRVGRACSTLAAVTLLLASACGGEPGTTESPRAAFRETTVDFGRVDQGTPIRVSFPLENTGGLPLTVDNLRAACGCTASVAVRRLLPGGSTAVTVTCDTSQMAGDVTTRVAVYSNDPRQPLTTLAVTGHVALEVTAEPRQLYLGQVARGEEVSGSVSLVAATGADIGFGPVVSDSAVLDVSLSSTAAGGRLQVRIKPDAPLGSFAEQVMVRTRSSRFPVLAVPVTGTVTGDLVFSPARLHFGSSTRGQQVARVVGVTNRGRQPVRIMAAQLWPPIGQAAVETESDGRRYRVTVTLDPDLPSGRIEGKLELRTDHPEQFILAVPFVGRVSQGTVRQRPKPQAMSRKSQATSRKLQVASRKRQATSCKLQVASYKRLARVVFEG